MPYKINILDKKATATFNDTAAKHEITNAFLEIVDTVDVKELHFIVFDCSEVVNYLIPADYLWRVKVLTRFSESWNPNITIIFVATNSEIQFMAKAYMNLSENLKWDYKLFENLEELDNWFDKKD